MTRTRVNSLSVYGKQLLRLVTIADFMSCTIILTVWRHYWLGGLFPAAVESVVGFFRPQ